MTGLLLLVSLWCGVFLNSYVRGEGYRATWPAGCDVVAAEQCEYDFLLCKLFDGPANDRPTLCRCAKEFYGDCLRRVGCSLAHEVGALTNHELYQKACISFIMEHDCPDTLICGVNCASDGNIDREKTKLVLFNNYGPHYLRVKSCITKVHEQKLSRYATVTQVSCTNELDYEICSRWIPPSSFIPVAVPFETTYMEVDSCTLKENPDGTTEYECFEKNPKPVRVYGNALMFPEKYTVEQNDLSVCSSDDDCLGSFCDTYNIPAICSPKTMFQVLGSGAAYMDVI